MRKRRRMSGMDNRQFPMNFPGMGMGGFPGHGGLGGYHGYGGMGGYPAYGGGWGEPGIGGYWGYGGLGGFWGVWGAFWFSRPKIGGGTPGHPGQDTKSVCGLFFCSSHLHNLLIYTSRMRLY